MAADSPSLDPALLPPGWAWARAHLPDGRSHCFGYSREADASDLLARAWHIWSPARAGPHGRFLTPGLRVDWLPTS